MTLQLEAPSAYFCFAPLWAKDVTFARRYLTNVMISTTGDEQRNSLLTTDRKRLAHSVRTGNIAETSYLRRYILKYRHLVWGVPVWVYEMELTTTVDPGATVLGLAETAYRGLSNGDKIIWVSGYSTYEEATIQTFTSTSITVTAGLTSQWRSGQKVYPMLSAELRVQEFPLQPQTPKHVDVTVEFTQSLRCEDA